MAFLGTTNAFPESKHRDRQLIMSQQSVFGLDALQSSKAITADVTNPDYDSYFGAIAYQKGELISSRQKLLLFSAATTHILHTCFRAKNMRSQ